MSIRQKEAVVLYIMNHVKAGDLVITQEHSTLLPKDVYDITPRGIPFEGKSIHTALNIR